MHRKKITGRGRLAVVAVAATALLAPMAATGIAHASDTSTTVRAVAGDTPGGGAGGQASLTPLQSGVATRPSGSDGYWPPVGTRVSWKVVRPIQDLIDQGKTYGYTNLGTIGNTYHLQRHGDHTPWSLGKVRGRIYAKDTAVPAGFEQWLVAKCKSNYNTLWIDFFNINGHQYNNAGTYLGTSSDQHFHVSVRKGYENTRVSLFRDFTVWKSHH